MEDWALKEALKRINTESNKPLNSFWSFDEIKNSKEPYAISARLLAEMIEKYEEKPADPFFNALIKGANRAYEEAGNTWPGTYYIASHIMLVLEEEGLKNSS